LEGLYGYLMIFFVFFVWNNLCRLGNTIIGITLKNEGGVFLCGGVFVCFFLDWLSLCSCFLYVWSSQYILNFFSLSLNTDEQSPENVAQYTGWQNILGLMQLLSLFGFRSDSGSLIVIGKTDMWHVCSLFKVVMQAYYLNLVKVIGIRRILGFKTPADSCLHGCSPVGF